MKLPTDLRGCYFHVGQKVARAVKYGSSSPHIVIEEVTHIKDDGRICLEGREHHPIQYPDRLVIVEH